MGRQKYEVDGKEYLFNTESYVSMLNEYKEKHGLRSFAGAYRAIDTKTHLGEDTLKKWTQGASSPADINKICDLAHFFGVEVKEMLKEKENEIVIKNTPEEKESIRRIVRCFSKLFHVFRDEKFRLYDSYIRPQIEGRTEDISLPEGMYIREQEPWDPEVFVSMRIENEKINTKSELAASLIDLPEEIIRELKILILIITEEEAIEGKYEMSMEEREDFDDVDTHILNYCLIDDTVKGFHTKFMEILKPYNLNINLERYL